MTSVAIIRLHYNCEGKSWCMRERSISRYRGETVHTRIHDIEGEESLRRSCRYRLRNKESNWSPASFRPIQPTVKTSKENDQWEHTSSCYKIKWYNFDKRHRRLTELNSVMMNLKKILSILHNLWCADRCLASFALVVVRRINSKSARIMTSFLYYKAITSNSAISVVNRPTVPRLAEQNFLSVWIVHSLLLSIINVTEWLNLCHRHVSHRIPLLYFVTVLLAEIVSTITSCKNSYI